jgi:hypothetical protein
MQINIFNTKIKTIFKIEFCLHVCVQTDTYQLCSLHNYVAYSHGPSTDNK